MLLFTHGQNCGHIYDFDTQKWVETSEASLNGYKIEKVDCYLVKRAWHESICTLGEEVNLNNVGDKLSAFAILERDSSKFTSAASSYLVTKKESHTNPIHVVNEPEVTFLKDYDANENALRLSISVHDKRLLDSKVESPKGQAVSIKNISEHFDREFARKPVQLKVMLKGDDLSKLDMETFHIKEGELEHVNGLGFQSSKMTMFDTKLTDVNFGGCRAEICMLTHCSISESKFVESQLLNCRMQKVVIFNSDFSKAVMDTANLNDCSISGSHFNSASLIGAHILGNTSKTKVSNSDFSESNLSESRLNNLEIRSTGARTAVFIRANMKNLTWKNSDLSACVFNLTSFENVTFKSVNFGAALLGDIRHKCLAFENCRFDGANFTNLELGLADLKNVEIKNSHLDGVDFYNCCLENVTFINCTFTGCSFRKCDMDTVKFSGCKFSDTELTGVVHFKAENIKGIEGRFVTRDRKGKESIAKNTNVAVKVVSESYLLNTANPTVPVPPPRSGESNYLSQRRMQLSKAEAEADQPRLKTVPLVDSRERSSAVTEIDSETADKATKKGVSK